MNSNETVGDRFTTLRDELSPIQLATTVLFGTAIAFTLVVVQEPLVHDSMHNFRHAAGIVCH